MSGASRAGVYQIGDVAERVNLSLRTVRYYEESGLLMPTGRTVGGFRLYDNDAIDRLLLIKKMKPLGFTLDEMRALLTLRDELLEDTDPDRREDLRERLRTWVVLAEEKLATLRQQVGVAEAFVTGLQEDTERFGTAPDNPSTPHFEDF
jgi:DNA-binding transcriptional MerR regulator